MVWDRLGQLGRPLVVMLAVIVMLVLVDVGIVAVRLTSGHPVGSVAKSNAGKNGSCSSSTSSQGGSSEPDD
ncbi:MAG: hypothetical protein E6I98_00770 [Chloroflexi bacterium]|nr:MAG: hypothetical protein E6I98_00770 [Chloroflexota bacterium]